MGRWSEFHDQRKGQWLINHIRFTMNSRGENEGKILFNMDNKDFDRLMEEYYTLSTPSDFPNQKKLDEMTRKILEKEFSPEITKRMMKINKEITKDG